MYVGSLLACVCPLSPGSVVSVMEGLILYFYFMLININLNSLLWQGAALESLQMDPGSASSFPFLCCQLEIKKQRQEKSKGVLLPHFILFRASLGLAIQTHGVQGSHCQGPMGCLMTRGKTPR